MSSDSDSWRCNLCRVKNPIAFYKCRSCETSNPNAPTEVKLKAEEEEKAKANAPSAFVMPTTSTTASTTGGFAFTPATGNATTGFAFTPSPDATASTGFAFNPSSSVATSTGFAFTPSTGFPAAEGAVKRSHDEIASPLEHTGLSPTTKLAKHHLDSDVAEEMEVKLVCTPEPEATELSFDMKEELAKLTKAGLTPGAPVVLTVGCGDMSQLGLGFDERECTTPTIVPTLLGKNIIAAHAGSLHNIVLTADGQVYSWGCNDDGALGRVTEADVDEFLPELVSGLEDENIVAIACGASHSVALSKEGKVFSWGAYRDASGLMGFDRENKTQRKAQQLMGFSSPVTKIAAGESHSLALTEDGKVYYWGDTFIGRRASDRTKRDRLSPQLVPIHRRKIKIHGRANLAKDKDDITIVDVFAGGYSCFALSKNGKIWAWGPNNYTQCGIERMDDEDHAILAPSIVPYFMENNIAVKSVTSSSHFTVFLTVDGRVFTVGRTTDGRMGQPKDYPFEHKSEQRVPLEVTTLSPTTLSAPHSWNGVGEGFDPERAAYFRSPKSDRVVRIDCGEAHAFAITEQGRLYGWGNGDLNQIGHGKEETVYTPVWVQSRELTSIPKKVIQASGGSQHSIILAKDISLLGNKENDKGKDKNGKQTKASRR